MRKDEFVFEKTVYLADTNAEGNVYFAKYLEWQGTAREEFFRRNVPEHMKILSSGIRLITANAWMVYHSECRLFDEVKIEVKTSNLKGLSLELVFTFTNETTGKLSGRGGEKLAFADKDGQLIQIPRSITENAKRFLIERAPELAEIGMRKGGTVSA